MTLGTSFEPTWISSPQGCSLPLPKYQCIPASGSWEDLWRFFKISLFRPLLGPKWGQPLYLNKSESPSPKHVYYQVLLKLSKWFTNQKSWILAWLPIFIMVFQAKIYNFKLINHFINLYNRSFFSRKFYFANRIIIMLIPLTSFY